MKKIICEVCCISIFAAIAGLVFAHSFVSIRANAKPVPVIKEISSLEKPLFVDGAEANNAVTVKIRKIEPRTISWIDKILPSVCPYKNVDVYEWNRCREEVASGEKIIIVYLDYSPDQGRLQHLVAYQNGSIKQKSLVSGAIGNVDPPDGTCPKEYIHNHPGLYKMIEKKKSYTSKAYKCPMPYSIFFYPGNAIHSCQKKDIGRLGGPASHGCIRNNPNDQPKLFSFVDANTWILIAKRK